MARKEQDNDTDLKTKTEEKKKTKKKEKRKKDTAEVEEKKTEKKKEDTAEEEEKKKKKKKGEEKEKEKEKEKDMKQDKQKKKKVVENEKNTKEGSTEEVSTEKPGEGSVSNEIPDKTKKKKKKKKDKNEDGNACFPSVSEQRGGKITFSDVSAKKRKKTETTGTNEEENASFLSDSDKLAEHRRGEKGISNVVITEKKTKKRRNVEEVEVVEDDDDEKATSGFSSAEQGGEGRSLIELSEKRKKKKRRKSEGVDLPTLSDLVKSSAAPSLGNNYPSDEKNEKEKKKMKKEKGNDDIVCDHGGEATAQGSFTKLEKKSKKHKRNQLDSRISPTTEDITHQEAENDASKDGSSRRKGNTLEMLSNGEDSHRENICNSSSDATPKSNLRRDTDTKKNAKSKKKRVSFQDQVMNEVPSDVGVSNEEDVDSVMNFNDEEIWGARFAPEEDELIKKAIFDYIKEKGWEKKDGLQKVLNCRKHKDAMNCWSIIRTCLPYRPQQAIRYRAHLLLEDGTRLGRWAKEEEDLLLRLQRERGHKWKEFSHLLGRDRMSIKEKWRTLKRAKGPGKWTQEELQKLSEQVHKCFRIKALLNIEQQNKSDRRILRDDISWEKIADDIGNHSHGACCGKWYYQLCSSMVNEGIWDNEDDFLLMKSLLESGACAEEEVDWDNILHHRSGNITLCRWKQMTKQLGENRTRQFLEKLDILAKRYAPELLENFMEGKN